MAALNVDDLYKKYDSFYYPTVKVFIGGIDPTEDKKFHIVPTDFDIFLTSDFKASIANFSLGGIYDSSTGDFSIDKTKKYFLLGSAVKISMGYSEKYTEVFRGYIARVEFSYDRVVPESTVIRITAMDLKGIMMANSYSKRLKANYYSDAVKEILDQSPYQKLKNDGVIKSLTISDTPDKPAGGAPAGGQAPDIRIEMVGESDYDFVVRAAKKFNFEFFSVGGNVVFRKAKLNNQILAEIYPHSSIVSYNIAYDLTSVVGDVKVRTMDIGKGNKIEAKKKNSGKFSIGSKAKPLVTGQSYVYIDSAIESQSDADQRAEYILEDISYRFGKLRRELRGMPEFVPGRFVTLKGFGEAVSNTFYITDVTHEYYAGSKYFTIIEAKAATL